MKRYLAFLLALLFIVGLAACGGGGESEPDATPSPDADLIIATPEPVAPPTLTIGALFTLSGADSMIGEAQLHTTRLWLDQRDWQIGPYEIILDYRDDQGSVDLALTLIEELIEAGADLLFGAHLSSVGHGMGELAISAGIPYIISSVPNDNMTQRGRQDLLIRTGSSASQLTHPFGHWAYTERDIRTVGIIAVDNTFGHESVAGFRRTFEEAGGAVLGYPIWVPAGTSDFAPFLAQLPDDMDALFVQFYGADARRVLEAIHGMGLEDTIILGGTATMDELVLGSLGPEVTAGIYSVSSSSASATEPFAARLGIEPSSYALETYIALDLLELAILEAGGFTDNFDLFLGAIRAIEAETVKGIITIDEWNNAVLDVQIRQVWSGGVNAPIYTFFEVSQFWRYDPGEFMALPAYDRAFDTAEHNRLLDAMRRG